MASSSDEDDRRAGVDAAFHGVDFNGWVVDVDNAADASRDGLAEVVDFRFLDLVGFEEGRSCGVERDHDAALQDRLRRVGSVCHWAGFGDSDGGGEGLGDSQ